MDGRAQQPDDFSGAFESAFACLQVRLEMSCVSDAPWPERAAAAVRAALEFAAEDPAAASVLTNGALAAGVDGLERYERLMSYVGGLLAGGRAECEHGAELPDSTERSLAGGVATIVANRVDRGNAAALPGLAADVVQFVLTPYMGTAEAKQLAAEAAADWPPSQPDR